LRYYADHAEEIDDRIAANTAAGAHLLENHANGPR